MKLMLNGAITLGTMDGANVEIAELVGNENIYMFGEGSDEIINHYEKSDYIAKDFYENDDRIKKCIDFIICDEMKKIGDKKSLNRLYSEIINKDWFMTLLDFNDYVKQKEKAFADYEDKKSWARKMLTNISMAGFFSSDRAIAEYEKDIWKVF